MTDERLIPTSPLTFRLPIGDWSDDGHSKVEWFRVEAVAPDIQTVREAYFRAEATLRGRGLRLETVFRDYEQTLLTPEQHAGVAAVVAAYPTLPRLLDDAEDYEQLYPLPFRNPTKQQMLAHWLCAVLTHVGQCPCRLLPWEPMLPFYGVDDQRRHLHLPGYGLFL